MKKNEVVGVWNHETGREDTGLIVDVKKVRNKYNNQINEKYFVMLEGKVYELYDFQIFIPGKATKNIVNSSIAKCFFSKQGRYARISLVGE
jgi:hypothetical protein